MLITTVRNNIYYHLKPLLPRRLQIYIRRRYVKFQTTLFRDVWPIDEKAGNAPEGWRGWPDGKKFALVLTHDVDTACGHARCMDLAGMEERLGFRSSFNFVPLRYPVSADLRKTLEERGFEIGVHGLYHDGKYYRSREIFSHRADRINAYIRDWKCAGYRAPSMCRKLEWFHDLNIEYDASTFDTDPFEPDAAGCGTIFPFLVRAEDNGHEYVELPYTMPQDFTLFVLMQLTDINIWKKKLDWVVRKGGVVLLNTHPDYMKFGAGKCHNEEYPSHHYEDFLAHVQSRHAGEYWHALPRDLARFWLHRSKQTGRENSIMTHEGDRNHVKT